MRTSADNGPLTERALCHHPPSSSTACSRRINNLENRIRTCYFPEFALTCPRDSKKRPATSQSSTTKSLDEDAATYCQSPHREYPSAYPLN
uniref:Uncharacterized protein n=1 Tax=Mesocestoides corti TaxID=53468 RepID=A0A5K3FAV2_MESCO